MTATLKARDRLLRPIALMSVYLPFNHLTLGG